MCDCGRKQPLLVFFVTTSWISESPMNESKRLGEHVIGAPFRWRAAILSRLSGPGGLYNLGDALGFGSGLLIAYLGWWESTNAVDNIFSIGMRYVAGSPAAVALTMATAIFFGSGEAYHRAWANGFPPDTKLTQIGDLFSGFGAIALGVGLYLLGNPGPRRHFGTAACRREVRQCIQHQGQALDRGAQH